MPRFSTVSLLVLACAACRSSTPPGDHREESGRLDALFPPAQQGLVLRSGPEPWTLSKLADEFSRTTGWTLIVDAETRRELEAAPAVTERDLEVAPANVYAFVEVLLVENQFALSVASDRAPRLLRVQSIRGPRAANLRSDAPLALDADLDAWADGHPAFLVRTLLVLEHLDARTLANSYRSQMADGNTQEVVPLGNVNQVLIVGFAPWVRRVRDEFLLLDRTEAGRAPPAAGSSGATGTPPQR